ANDPTLPEGYINVLKTHVPGTDKAFGHRLVRVGSGNQDVSQPAAIFSFDAGSGELNVLAVNAINPYFVHPNFLAYQIGDDDGQLVVRKLNRQYDGFEGPAVDAVSGVATTWGDYNVTPQGDLIYLNAGGTSLLNTELWEADLGSRVVRPLEGASPGSDIIANPAVSPDGRWLAFTYRTPANNYTLHLYDIERQLTRQIAFQHTNFAPSFSHDSRWIYWSQSSDGSAVNVLRIPVDLSSPQETFIRNAGGAKFSPDGRWLAFTARPGQNPRLLMRDLRSGAETVKDSTGALPFAHSFSVDSRYLAYSTDVASSSQIRVVATDGTERYDIPGVRARSVVFADDGQSLLIEAGSTIHRLPIRTQPSFVVQGNQEMLLNVPYVAGFDVHGANTVFLSAAAVQFTGGESNTSLVWMQNWSSHLQEELGE
ncbi:MAG: hypothetical protein HKN17_08875, partial [Rhodothermales bacterium]|nr:hypothetical protein [Rhodothermales bacterium]